MDLEEKIEKRINIIRSMMDSKCPEEVSIIKDQILLLCLIEHGVYYWEKWDDAMVTYHASIGADYDDDLDTYYDKEIEVIDSQTEQELKK